MPSHNVLLTFLFKIGAGITAGAWSQVAMPNYIYLTQGHSNKLVGLAEGIQGTCNALSAIPAGRLADKTRRDTLLRFFGAVGIVSIVTLAAAVLVPNHTLHLGSLALNSSYVLLCCGLALAGSTNGGASVSDALFADSIATGVFAWWCWIPCCSPHTCSPHPAAVVLSACKRQRKRNLPSRWPAYWRPPLWARWRVPCYSCYMALPHSCCGARSKYFTALFASVLAAASVGPLLGALLFTLHGNRWDVHTLQIIILWGIGLALLPIGCMFFFNDDKSLGAESEAHLHEPLLGASPAAEADAEAGEAAPLHPDSAPVSGDKQAAAEPSAVPPRGTQRLSSAWIPYILASSDFVAGIASGMTIKFFPIFFLEAVQLPPIQVSVIMAATPLAIALMSAAVQPLSHTLGRAQTCLLTRLVAVVLLFYMGLVPTIWTRLAIIIPVFVVRGATSNCSYGLRKSILMDFVPKTKRATWNSLESVMVFGWSGSAFVGGLLVDSCGFDITFIITAVLQLVSCLMFIPLLALVPRREHGLGAGAASASATSAGGLASRPADVSTCQQRVLDYPAEADLLEAAGAGTAVRTSLDDVSADASLLGARLGESPLRKQMQT